MKDGFSVDVSRLLIDPDSTKTVTFKFEPGNQGTTKVFRSLLSNFLFIVFRNLRTCGTVLPLA